MVFAKRLANRARSFLFNTIFEREIVRRAGFRRLSDEGKTVSKESEGRRGPVLEKVLNVLVGILISV